VTDDKAIAGPILSFVGGLVILIVGAAEAYVGQAVGAAASMAGLPNTGSAADIVWIGIVGGFCGFVIMVLAIIANLSTDFRGPLGALILLFSLFSLVSSIGVGFLLAVLGGTATIAFGPDDPTDRTPPPMLPAPYPVGASRIAAPPVASVPEPVADSEGRTHRACPFCGSINAIQAAVCHQCGRKIPPISTDGTDAGPAPTAPTRRA